MIGADLADVRRPGGQTLVVGDDAVERRILDGSQTSRPGRWGARGDRCCCARRKWGSLYREIPVLVCEVCGIFVPAVVGVVSGADLFRGGVYRGLQGLRTGGGL